MRSARRTQRCRQWELLCPDTTGTRLLESDQEMIQASGYHTAYFLLRGRCQVALRIYQKTALLLSESLSIILVNTNHTFLLCIYSIDRFKKSIDRDLFQSASSYPWQSRPIATFQSETYLYEIRAQTTHFAWVELVKTHKNALVVPRSKKNSWIL